MGVDDFNSAGELTSAAPANRLTVVLNYKGTQINLINNQRLENLVSLKSLQDFQTTGRLFIPLTAAGSLFLNDEMYLTVTYDGTTGTNIDLFNTQDLGEAPAVLTYKAIHFNENVEKDLDLADVFGMDLTGVVACTLTDSMGNTYKLSTPHEVVAFFQASRGVKVMFDHPELYGTNFIGLHDCDPVNTTFTENLGVVLFEAAFVRGTFMFLNTGVKNIIHVNEI